VEAADRPSSIDARLAELIDDYARRVYPAVLEQHGSASVCSPLGVWLLLAACGPVSAGEDRAALERVLGCPAEEAARLLEAFMAAPPPSLKAAIAMWIRQSDFTPAVSDWIARLPPQLETGAIPTQAHADEWARRHTLGLIDAFPLPVDERTRIVLASALATKVSWPKPFDLVPAAEHLADGSPWRGQVQRLLWEEQPSAGIVKTEAAGLVAFHRAVAKEELTVVSVSAAAGTPRAAVLDAAHELIRDGHLPDQSLFKLPLGSGHSWAIAEHEVAAATPGDRIERIDGASLPAWRVEDELDLLRSELFGSHPALETMRKQIGPRPDDAFGAKQAAVASFTRFGFEAAAVTALAMATSAMPPPHKGLLRTATLRFDHPYAVLAVAGDPQRACSWSGLPLFTAWVDSPEEPADDAPA
jgi:Serpin (serine protease inhibitor)